MQNFIQKPSVDLYPGIVVHGDTVMDYENEHVTQHLENLRFHSVTRIQGEKFQSTYDTFIQLEDGDILIFDDEKRGYIKPVEGFMTVAEAVRELESIKSLG